MSLFYLSFSLPPFTYSICHSLYLLSLTLLSILYISCCSPVAGELVLHVVPAVEVGGHTREAGGDVVKLVEADATAEGVGSGVAMRALLR